jgi:hypothetical protein
MQLPGDAETVAFTTEKADRSRASAQRPDSSRQQQVILTVDALLAR